jgi:hypothetical protein
MTLESELHQYIRKVLETGDHGPIRHIPFDKTALNDAIDKYRPQIGKIRLVLYTLSLICVCSFVNQG